MCRIKGYRGQSPNILRSLQGAFSTQGDEQFHVQGVPPAPCWPQSQWGTRAVLLLTISCVLVPGHRGNHFLAPDLTDMSLFQGLMPPTPSTLRPSRRGCTWGSRQISASCPASWAWGWWKVRGELLQRCQSPHLLLPLAYHPTYSSGYDSMGYEMSKPDLRAELEADLKLICEGKKDKSVVLQQQVQKYKQVFIEAVARANK